MFRIARDRAADPGLLIMRLSAQSYAAAVRMQVIPYLQNHYTPGYVLLQYVNMHKLFNTFQFFVKLHKGIKTFNI